MFRHGLGYHHIPFASLTMYRVMSSRSKMGRCRSRWIFKPRRCRCHRGVSALTLLNCFCDAGFRSCIRRDWTHVLHDFRNLFVPSQLVRSGEPRDLSIKQPAVPVSTDSNIVCQALLLVNVRVHVLQHCTCVHPSLHQCVLCNSIHS